MAAINDGAVSKKVAKGLTGMAWDGVVEKYERAWEKRQIELSLSVSMAGTK